jgi:hypothetical protein
MTDTTDITDTSTGPLSWKNAEIKTAFNNVVRDSKTMSTIQLETKYDLFIKDFRKLYDIALESVVSGKVQESIKILDMMLSTRNNVKSGSMNKMTADMFVGNQLGHKYIYPKTNVPSVEDYKQAIDKIKEGKTIEPKVQSN